MNRAAAKLLGGAAASRSSLIDPVREVRVRTEAGKVLRILCNDLDASAQEIADLYKRRWAIELFFRWVKQTLKIRHFLGTSENAVRIQIAVALIAYLLLRLAQADQEAVESPLVNLTGRRSFGFHQGQRSAYRSEKAGYMTASSTAVSNRFSPCITGGVHTGQCR